MSSDFQKARILGIVGSIIIIVFGGIIGWAKMIGTIIGTVELIINIILGIILGDFRGLARISGIVELIIIITLSSFVGWILILISLYLFSRVYNEPRIFRNALYSTISGLIALIVPFIIFIIFTFYLGREATAVLRASAILLIVFIILYGYFIYMSLSLLAEKSGEALFKGAGILMLMGVITGIVGMSLSLLAEKSGEALFKGAGILMLMGVITGIVGLLISLVGIIVLAAAFYTVKPPQPSPP